MTNRAAESSLFSQLRALWRGDTWVKPYFGRYRRTLVASVALGVLTLVFAIALMFTSGFLISASAMQPTAGLFELLIPIGFVQLFGVGKPFFGYFERLTSHDWVFRMTSSLRVRLYDSIESEGMFWSTTHRAGDVLGLLAQDIGHVQNLYLRTVFPLVIAWLLGGLVVVCLGWFSLPFALMMLVGLLVMCVLLPLVAVLVNGGRQEEAKRIRGELYAQAYDGVAGVGDWVYAQREGDYVEGVVGLGRALDQVEGAMRASSRRRALVLQVVFVAVAVALIVWAQVAFGGESAVAARDAGASATGALANWIAAFVLGYFPLLEALEPLSDASVEAVAHADSVRRFNAMPEPGEGSDGVRTPGAGARGLDSPDGVSAQAAGVDAQVGGCLAESARQGIGDAEGDGGAAAHRGGESHDSSAMASSLVGDFDSPHGFDIELRDVTFAYPGGGEPILSNVNLRIPAGQRVAILGRSGAGKSTLTSLIRGDLAPVAPDVGTPEGSPIETVSGVSGLSRGEAAVGSSAAFGASARRVRGDLAPVVPVATAPGSVTIGGVPAVDLNARNLIHRYVGLMQQNTYLFNQTLMGNLKIGNPKVTEEEAVAALRAVGLGPLFDRLPEGLATMVDEAGLRFSGGERQRIALARLLLQDSPIVILDEATVGLDPLTEGRLLDAIFDVFAGRTLIMVTHHLKGIDHMDRVLFVEDGAVAMDGTPADLARTNPDYQQLLAFDRGDA